MAIFRRIRFAVTLLVLLMALVVAAETAITTYAAPAITLNVSSGSPPIVGAGSVILQPGTEVTISGTGFASADNGCTITSSAAGLVIDTSSEPPCSVNGSGQLTALFKVGAGSIWEVGGYGVTVTGAINTASTPGNAFFVLPAITLLPVTGVGGTSVSIYGSGFSGTTTSCAVVTGSPPVAASPPATCAESTGPGSTLGDVTGTFTVDPTSPPGSYFIQVADASPAPIATSPPFVVGGSTATLTFSPANGPTGTVVTVSGSGWHASDTSVTLTQTSGPSTTLWSGSNPTCSVSGGVIAPGCTFTVQSAALGGVYTITGTGSQGEDVTAQFEVTSTLFVSPLGGGSGTAVTISGSGYAGPISSATCPTDLSSAPSGLVTSAACTVNANGVLSGTFTVGPSLPAGTYQLILTNAAKVVPGPSVSASFNVGVAFVSLSASSGPTGTVVTVTGSGWNSGDTSVSFTSTPTGLWNAPATQSCAVSGGSITGCSFTVSATALGGLYKLTFTGSQGDSAKSAFTVTSTFTLTPNSGPQGSSVLLAGTGYSGAITSAACGTDVTSSPSGLITSLSCSATSAGVLSGSFTVAAAATPGTYQVILTSTKVVPGPSISASFTVTIPSPTITLNPSAVSAGGTVTISGSGFKSSDTCNAASITSTPSNIVTAAACKLSGGIIIQPTDFTVLSTASPGTYTISVKGSSGDSASALLTVVSQTSVVFTPGAAPVGATVGVTATDTGHHHVAGTCSISGSPVTLVGCTEASSGAISGSFIVANVAPGPYQVQIIGTSGAILFGVFIVQGPFIQLSDTLSIGQVASGPTGSEVIIKGAFFPLSDTTCTISTTSNGNFIAPNTAACSVFAGSGLFAGFNNVTGSFIVGNVNPGQYIVQVTTSPSGQFAQAVFNVTSGPFIQLFPSNGATGTHVTIEGSNFLPSDTTCTLSSPTNGNAVVDGACSFFTATSGNFKGFMNVTGTFVVGNVPPGDYVIQVGGDQGDQAQTIFDVTSGPFIQLFPSTGPTGTHVTIEGSNFLPTDTTCSVSSPTNGNAVVDGACSFFIATTGSFKGLMNVTGTFIVGNVPPGDYVIQVDGNQGDSAQAVFDVTTGPTITLSPASGPVGIHVTVNGTGFLPTDTSCTVTSPTSGSIVLDGACAAIGGTGKVEASFLVGSVPAGQYVIEVDGSAGDLAQALFNVTVGPTITLSPTAGRIGTEVTVTGSGFLPTDTSCTITSPSSSMITIAACSVRAGTGKISGSFTVGNVGPGQYVVEVDGSPGADFAQAVFTITIGPTLTLSPASGRIGVHVFFNGTGFLPTDSSCTVSSPGSSAVLAGTAACSIVLGSGAPTGSFTIGNVVPGQYVIEVDGSPGSDFVQRVFNVTIGAMITLSPGTARPGGGVIVNGTGFLPTDSSCTILSPGSNAVLTGSAACAIQLGTGVIQGSFIVGNVQPGQYVIQVSGDQSDFAQAVLNVTGGPSLTLTPIAGTIGTTISIHGSGFLTTDQSCSISSISTPNPILPGSSACAITVGTGIVTGSFIIGDVPAGEYVIEVTACSGNNGCAPSAGDFAQAVLTVNLGAATLTLFPSSAAEETTVTFIGTGLSSSDTGCSVESFNGATPDNTLITSSSCSVVTPGIAQGTFVVSPYATSDISWNVKVEGSPVDDLTPAAAFTVIPDVIVTPTSGTVNTVFTFTGSGFSSTATSCTAVTVPAFGTPGCAISGNTGQVSGSVVVPAGTIAGTYGLKVTDSTGKTAAGVFTIGTPSALLVLNPASVGQGQPVGIAGFGFNPQDAYCVIYPQPPAFPIGPVPPGQATCQISGGYASGSFVVSPSAPGGYYLITVIACSIAPTNDVCPAADTLDFASNFLGVTLATTITTYSTTTSTSSTTTSMSTTTTTVATSFSYSSTTYSTTGILYTTYTHQSLTTVSAPTTTTITQTTSTTQTQTTVSLSTTTAYTTVPCGPLPCGFAIQPAPVNPAPSIDSAGLLAALLLVIPMLLRRLFG